MSPKLVTHIYLTMTLLYIFFNLYSETLRQIAYNRINDLSKETNKCSMFGNTPGCFKMLQPMDSYIILLCCVFSKYSLILALRELNIDSAMI